MSIKSDEELKKSQKPGDIENYNKIVYNKDLYKEAELKGDKQGMIDAHNNNEAIRSVYGYQTDEYGNNPTLIEGKKTGDNPVYNHDNYNAYKDYKNKYVKAYEKGVDNQTNDMITNIERNGYKIKDSYNNAYKDLIKNRNDEIKKLPKNLAKIGLYGSGTGETAISNIQSVYASELNKLKQNKDNALYDLDSEILKVKQQGAKAINDFHIQMYQEDANSYMDYLDRIYTEINNDKNYERSVFESDRNYNFQKELNENQLSEQEYNKKLNEANIKAQYGDFSGYADLGFSEDSINQMKKAYDYQMLSLSGSRTSGGSSSGSKSTAKQLDMSYIDAEISHWLYSTKKIRSDEPFYEGWNKEDTKPQYAAADKIRNGDAIRYIKDELIKAGYTASQANAKIEEYKNNIAKEIATIEGKDVKDVKERYGW